MKGKSLLNHSKKFFIGLLILCIAANGTQAVVMCAGDDGHVAVEMAGHHHCHTPNTSQDAAHNSSNDADEHKVPCRLCVDIPLSPGISKDAGGQKMPVTNEFTAGIALFIPAMADFKSEVFAIDGACLADFSFYKPLSSIILIV